MQGGGPTSNASSDNIVSGVCYILGFFAVIFLFIAPYSTNPAVRFHALQSTAYSVAVIVLFIAVNIVLGIIASIVPLFSMLFLLMPLLWLVVVGVAILLAVKAFQGQGMELPVIGEWARRTA